MRFSKGSASGQAAIEFIVLGIVIVIAMICITMVSLDSDASAPENKKGSVEFEQTRTGTVKGKYIDSGADGKHYYVTVENGGYEADHEVSLAEYNAAQVDAELYSAQKDAEGIKAKATAEAEATRLKGEADGASEKSRGEGIAAGVKAQAEAYNGMENPYLLANRYIDIMPKVAEEVAKPLTAVDSIKMYGSGNAQKLVKETTAIVDQVASGLKDSTGVDLPSLLSGLLAKSDMDASSAESLAD